MTKKKHFKPGDVIKPTAAQKRAFGMHVDNLRDFQLAYQHSARLMRQYNDTLFAAIRSEYPGLKDRHFNIVFDTLEITVDHDKPKSEK